jgi:hypothetical protein
MKSMGRLFTLLALLLSAWPYAACASPTSPTIYPTTGDVVCATDAACAAIANIEVQTVTINGVAGIASYAWVVTCANGPNDFTPAGTHTGCFAYEPPSGSATAASNSSITALTGLANPFFPSVALVGDITGNDWTAYSYGHNPHGGINALGYHAVGDYGAGSFAAVSACILRTGICIRDSVGNYFQRLYSGPTLANYMGAYCDAYAASPHDDSGALTTWLSSSTEGEQLDWIGQCKSTTALTLGTGANLGGAFGFSTPATVGFNGGWTGIGGSALVFTNSSSCGLTVYDSANAAQYRGSKIARFALIGPGAGTCVGLTVGHSTGTPGTANTNGFHLDTVLVGNFYTCATFYGMEDSTFIDHRCWGDVQGHVYGDVASNANTFTGTSFLGSGSDTDTAAVDLTDTVGTYGNRYYGTLFHGDKKNPSVILSGSQGWLIDGGNWENDSTTTNCDWELTNTSNVAITNGTDFKRCWKINTGTTATFLNNLNLGASLTMTVSTTAGPGNSLGTYTNASGSPTLTISDANHKLSLPLATKTLVVGSRSAAYSPTPSTGDGSIVPLVFDAIELDALTEYPPGGPFTAKNYEYVQFKYTVFLTGITGSNTLCETILHTTNGNYEIAYFNPVANSSGTYSAVFDTPAVQMNAGDTAYETLSCSGAGSKNITIGTGRASSYMSITHAWGP